MYLTKQDIKKWCNHINDNVKDQTKGSLLISENTDEGIISECQGSYEEMLKSLASLTFMIGYDTGHEFEDVIDDLNKTWDEMISDEKLTIRQNDINESNDGGHMYINPKSSFAYNYTDGEEIQMEEFCKKYIDPLNELLETLKTVDGVVEIIADSHIDNTFKICENEDGDAVVFFTWHNKKFMYNFACEGILMNYGSVKNGDSQNFKYDVIFNDKAFRYVISRLMTDDE